MAVSVQDVARYAMLHITCKF